MSGRIRQEDVEMVRERANIVEVVGQYLQLRKAGADRFVGLCPFHTEKTASFGVSPSKQLYHCFGCGVGGNVFHFLMAVENLGFPEAVERLAKQAGVTLRYEGLTESDRRDMSKPGALHRANQLAAELYHQNLLESPENGPAREFLASRALTREAAVEFGIGLAPGFPDFLLRRLAGKLSAETLVEAGLVVKDARGALRDRFRGRVTFPLHDLTGRNVGFGARLLAGEGPKYVNTPETSVYRKGELLYNLHRAKAAITRTSTAVVVEGYTDVIALGQGGVATAVATCGTALSESHFRLLSRFAERAVLSFDSDDAGAKAAERAYAFHEEHPVEAVVLVLPEGLDPADFVARHGAEAFEELANRATPLVEYMIDRTLSGRDTLDPEDRARAVRDALPIVAGLRDPVRREQYASLLADRVGVDVRSVLMELQFAERAGGGGNGASAASAEARAARAAPAQRVEREALKLLVQHPGEARVAFGALGPDHFPTALYRRAWEVVRGESGPLADRVGEADEKLAALLPALAVEPLEGDPTREYAEGVANRLEEFELSRRIALVRKRLEPLNPTVDPAGYDTLFQELMTLEGARRRVRSAGQSA